MWVENSFMSFFNDHQLSQEYVVNNILVALQPFKHSQFPKQINPLEVRTNPISRFQGVLEPPRAFFSLPLLFLPVMAGATIEAVSAINRCYLTPVVTDPPWLRQHLLAIQYPSKSSAPLNTFTPEGAF
ncbi:hypothetical protein BT63DRAFT_310155 [Microthyrium microscopicum]|uniref:Uncharacterized protein n=1 Tax=Microthyrium microscopicum TaxID=703497 RepID=A0A6A6U2G3_9PEZI|nr:hypothetical protein BT63DRAFT_310155 [Microthyrium microscopicum]